MKRIILYAWLGLATLAVSPVLAGEEPSGEQKTMGWKWANFGLLVVILGYVAAKKGGAFFAARNEGIQKSMAEARKMKEEADAQLAAMEQRLAGIEADIRSIRDSARQESAAESARSHQELEREMAKIQTHARMEIEAASNAARTQLKIYTGELATELARQKIAAQLSPQAHVRLVEMFVSGLKSGETGRGAI